MQCDKNYNNGQWRGNPGEFVCETDLFEEVLQPDECDDSDLGLVEDVGVDEDCTELIENDKWQEENDGIDRAAGAFEVRAGSEVYQLCLAGAFVLHKFVNRIPRFFYFTCRF